MATSKNRINAYVDDISDQAFKEWCVTNGCTASKGVELLIKQCLLGVAQNQVTGNVPIPDNIVTKEALDKAIAEVRNELGQAKLWLHETSVTYDVIAELETKFDDKLGDFKSLVADTAPTLDGTITPLVKRIESLETELKKDAPLG
jgi:hypothetical protein